MERTPIGKKLRFEVFKRDGFMCQYCGQHPPQTILEIDHIHPVSKGGTNDIDNLMTSCQPCNRGKGANDLEVAPLSIAEKTAILAEKQAQLAEFNKLQEAIKERQQQEIIRISDCFAKHWDCGRAHEASIARFLNELGYYDVEDAALIAASKFGTQVFDLEKGAPGSNQVLQKAFRYFCGICHNKMNGVTR